MIKSPLRYPGGKSKSAKLITSLIPEFKEYREPFVGGGSICLYLKQIFPNRLYKINDLYPELYNFWQISQNNMEALIDQIYDWRNTYKSGRDLYTVVTKNIQQYNAIEKAAAFFICNRITFSGTTESGGYSQQAFDGRFTESSIKRIRSFSSEIQNITITNNDYKQLVQQDGEDIFLYLDPPYYAAKRLYGKAGNMHSGFNHEEFAAVMKECHHKWLITYDDIDYIRELFSFANISSWTLSYGMKNVNTEKPEKGKELFITNY